MKKPPENSDAEPQHSEITSSKLPTLTHLQFLALDLLSSADCDTSAHLLQKGVCRLVPDYSGPKFYQLMGRLSRDGFVEAKSRTIETAGGRMQRTFYSITPEGSTAMKVTRLFYEMRHTLGTLLD